MNNIGTDNNYAQTRQTWRNTNIRKIFANIVKQHPNAEEKDLRKHFRKEARLNDDAFLAIADYAFEAVFRAYTKQKSKKPVSAAAKANIATKRAKELREHATKVAYVKEQIILLNMIMPNGLPLSECTGRDCSKFNGWLSKLSALVKPNEKVGDVLSESEVRKLYT